jgi:hypothetical protein
LQKITNLKSRRNPEPDEAFAVQIAGDFEIFKLNLSTNNKIACSFFGASLATYPRTAFWNREPLFAIEYAAHTIDLEVSTHERSNVCFADGRR